MTLRIVTKTALMLAVIGLAACGPRGGSQSGDGALGSSQDRFGTGYGQGAGAGAGRGDASDPSSPAYFQQVIGDRVLFAVDQSTLTSEARATLDSQARWLLTNTDVTALIEGHADEQGTREYNIALSARRADAVRSYLISQGVSANRLSTVPFGKERPAETCSEERCYQANRRAVTVLRLPNLSS